MSNDERNCSDTHKEISVSQITLEQQTKTTATKTVSTNITTTTTTVHPKYLEKKMKTHVARIAYCDRIKEIGTERESEREKDFVHLSAVDFGTMSRGVFRGCNL